MLLSKTGFFVTLRKIYNKRKLKIRAPTWNDEFELPDSIYWVSNRQHYNDYIIEKYKTVTTPLPIHIYIHRVSNSLVFKIKYGYKMSITLFGSTGKLVDKTKNEENVPSLEVAQIVLVQRKFLVKQYQQKSQVLYTFTSNNSCVYLSNIEPSNLVFLKTCTTDFGNIIITFTDQNNGPSKIEDKINLT